MAGPHPYNANMCRTHGISVYKKKSYGPVVPSRVGTGGHPYHSSQVQVEFKHTHVTTMLYMFGHMLPDRGSVCPHGLTHEFMQSYVSFFSLMSSTPDPKTLDNSLSGVDPATVCSCVAAT